MKSATNANVFEAAPCVGLWYLFDSIKPEMHAEAKAMCENDCPVVASCQARRDKVTCATDGIFIAGTWAGELHGSKAKVRDVA